MNKSLLPRTLVEFVGRASDEPWHVVREVYVNGSPVLVEKDGIDIEYGDNAPTVVVLRLLPSEVRFRSADERPTP